MDKIWSFKMVALFCVFMGFLMAAACDGGDDENDDDDEKDDDQHEPAPCGDGLGDMTCLEYCICLRNACLEHFPKGDCNEEMCRCSDQFGCLHDSVVETYECYL